MQTTETKLKAEESSQSTELRVARQEIRCLKGRETSVTVALVHPIRIIAAVEVSRVI